MEISTQLHWKLFSDFCRFEIASGGPDPQIPLTSAMSVGLTDEERLWHGWCYITVYNVPFAEILWRFWSLEAIKKESVKTVELWLKDSWAGITTRVERRCIRTPASMAQFMKDFIPWYQMLPELRNDPIANYEILWDYSLKTKNLGRYVALKLLEYMKKYCGYNLLEPDIRPKGGWSPRYTLGLLFPNEGKMEHSNHPEILRATNKLVDSAIQRLHDEFRLEVDKFQLQVMLCEYRESIESRRQYPGRSHDSEWKYYLKAHEYWNHNTMMFDARSKIFPKQHLGEVGGWQGTREILGTLASEYGYMWSDMIYDYPKTIDFANPVERSW